MVPKWAAHLAEWTGAMRALDEAAYSVGWLALCWAAWRVASKDIGWVGSSEFEEVAWKVYRTD